MKRAALTSSVPPASDEARIAALSDRIHRLERNLADTVALQVRTVDALIRLQAERNPTKEH